MFTVNERYQKLEIYQLSHQLVLDVYEFSRQLPVTEESVLGSQMRRAALSIPLNIAEGSGAGSYKTFLNFLLFSFRSAKEVEACFALCRDLHFVTLEQYAIFSEQLGKIIGKLYHYMMFIDSKCDRRKSEMSYALRSHVRECAKVSHI